MLKKQKKNTCEKPPGVVHAKPSVNMRALAVKSPAAAIPLKNCKGLHNALCPQSNLPAFSCKFTCTVFTV